MSLTFTLFGRDSVLKTRIFPPIIVGDSATMALTGFDTFNSIPNINETNNTIHYKFNNEFYSINIPPGAYEIEDIQNTIQSLLKKDLDERDPNRTHPDGDMLFSLKSNKSTLKCVIHSGVTIDFSKTNSIGKILGFKPKILESGRDYESDNIVNITNINSIRIECNLTTGSYINGKLSHTIYEFFPCVPPGYKILEYPKNTIYLPLSKRVIDEISVQIVDQDGNLVSFMNELITVRLHLKK